MSQNSEVIVKGNSHNKYDLACMVGARALSHQRQDQEQCSGARAVVKFHEGMCAARQRQAHRHQAPLTHIPYEFLYAGTSYTHTCRHRGTLHIASQMLLGMVDRCTLNQNFLICDFH